MSTNQEFFLEEVDPSGIKCPKEKALEVVDSRAFKEEELLH
jgi:hypothetical protein